jgi:hypothetical protein
VVKRRYPREALVIDTETASGPSQRLNFGFWRFYRDRGAPGTVCIEEGLLYADDLPQRDPGGFAALSRFAETTAAEVAPGYAKRIALLSATDWLQQRLFRYGYHHRDRCDVVGYHILFDFGRLAAYWSPAGGNYRGGWSLGFWGHFDSAGQWHDRRFHPRLLAKAIDPRRTLFAWGSVKRGDEDGLGTGARVVDLHQVVFALTDRSLALEGAQGACAAFGDRYLKPPVKYGVIDERMLEYARDDVRHTALLYRNTQQELRRHVGVRLEAHQLFSPATVGVRYLEAMGLRRPLEKFTCLEPRRLGWRETGVNAPKRKQRRR